MTRPRNTAGTGQALVEFALVAPIFFLLVFSIIQVGLLMASQNGLVDGVRSGARRAATYRVNEGNFDPSVFGELCTAVESELVEQVSQRLIGWYPAGFSSTISYEWEGNPETGEYFLVARVDATFDNPLYVPMVSTFLDGTDGTVDDVLTLTASEKMRVENPALDQPSDLSAQVCT